MTEHSEKLERQAAANKKWEEIQTKAFTHWVNSVLSKRDESIEDLLTGFQTGVQLVNMIEILSGKKMDQRWTKKPSQKIHKINNCFIALKFLQEECNVKGITVQAEDLVNAENLVLILGFCWLLLRTFQEPAPETGEKGSSFEANLLNWLKEKLKEYKDLDFSDGFKSDSFCNGKALLALVNEWKKGLVDYGSFKPQDKVSNCEHALKTAEEHIKLPSIIDPEELAEGKTSEKNLVLYLSLFYNAFKDQQSSENKDSLMKRLQDLEEKVRVLTIENEALKKAIQSLTVDTTSLSEQLTVLSEEKTTLTTSKEELETKLGELKETYNSETTGMKGKIEQLTENISLLKTNTAGDTAELQNLKEALQKERDQIREELKKTKEKLMKEKEELTAANEQLKSNLRNNTRLKAELEEIMNKQQANNELTAVTFRKHLLNHIKNLNKWKVYLESDREYVHEEVKFVEESSLEGKPFNQQVNLLDKAVIDDNKRLEKLVKEREVESAEVVAVNIGKKKKRIKKNDPLIEALDEKQKPKTKEEEPKTSRKAHRDKAEVASKGKKEEKKEEKKEDKKEKSKSKKK